MTRIEVPIEDARPGDIAVLKYPTWPSEVEAEVYERYEGLHAAGYTVFHGGYPGPAVKRVYREVPDLPTEPGSVIRATIRGVPDTVATLSKYGGWRTSTPIKSHCWHQPEHIYLSTVVVGRVVFDGDAS